MTEELAPSEVAKRLGTSTRTVQRWIERGVSRPGVSVVVGVSRLTRSTRHDAREPTRRAPSEPVHRESRRDRAADRADVRSLGIRAVVPDTDGPTRSTCSMPTPSSRRRAPAAPTPSIPASGSSPRTPTSPSGSIAAGLTLGRAAARRDPRDGRQGRRAAAGGLARHPGRSPGYDGPDQSDAALDAAARADRLPAPRQAGGRRRRQGHARRPRPGHASRTRSPRPGARRRPRSATTASSSSASSRARATSRSRSCSMPRGNGVHLGERDCSIQRRHQKILEESPSPAVDADAARARWATRRSRLARAVGYVNAGTVRVPRRRARRADLPRDEHAPPGRASGHRARHRPRPRRRPAPDRRRRAARVRAGATSATTATRSRSASTPRMRRTGSCRRPVGSRPFAGRPATASGSMPGSTQGTEVGGRFDPMLAKIIAWGADRDEALARLTAALDDTVVLGLVTNLRFLRWLVRAAGRPRWRGPHRHARPDLAAGRLGGAGARSRTRPGRPPLACSPGPAPRDRRRPVVRRLAAQRRASASGSRPTAMTRSVGARRRGAGLEAIARRRRRARRCRRPERRLRARPAARRRSGRRRGSRRPRLGRAGGPASLIAPMPGAVLTVHVPIGRPRSRPAIPSSPSRR